MLAQVEDLFDSWPGTLIVVSHDRYLIERVTDTQYGVLDGRLRHLPGGIDQYLALQNSGSDAAGVGGAGLTDRTPAGRAETSAGTTGARAAGAGTGGKVGEAAASGAQERARRKELAATERKLAKATKAVASIRERLEAQDPTDYEALTALTNDLQEAEMQVSTLEDHWLDLSIELD
jgi:hypothetical protein